MVLNSATEFIMQLHQGYQIDVVGAKRMINRDGSNRTGKEVIISYYQTNQK